MSTEVRPSNPVVQLLREAHENNYGTVAGQPFLLEAATEIEALERLDDSQHKEIERLRAALEAAQVEALGCSAAASSEFKTEALHSVIAICARALNEAAPRDETTK
jgi:hypothetical protein